MQTDKTGASWKPRTARQRFLQEMLAIGDENTAFLTELQLKQRLVKEKVSGTLLVLD